MAAKDNPRTIKMRHPDKGTEMVTPEVAGVIERQGWERVGGPVGDVEKAVERATAPLKARIAELEQKLADAGLGDQLPATANDLIAWIGNDPERAAQAQAAEAERPEPRKTVTEHIESVLNPSPPKED